jgi:hypothetical protein
MVTLQQLRYFLAAVERGTVSAAAEACFVSQPSLSEQLWRLEQVPDAIAPAPRTASSASRAAATARSARGTSSRPASVNTNPRLVRTDNGTPSPCGPQLPVYSQQAALVARMLRIVPDQRELAARFAASEPLDTRIDIVRAIWQRQMRRAHRALDAFDRAPDFAGATR